MGILNRIADELRKPRPKFAKGDTVTHKMLKKDYVVKSAKFVDDSFVYSVTDGTNTMKVDEVLLKRKIQLGY